MLSQYSETTDSYSEITDFIFGLGSPFLVEITNN